MFRSPLAASTVDCSHSLMIPWCPQVWLWGLPAINNIEEDNKSISVCHHSRSAPFTHTPWKNCPFRAERRGGINWKWLRAFLTVPFFHPAGSHLFADSNRGIGLHCLQCVCVCVCVCERERQRECVKMCAHIKGLTRLKLMPFWAESHFWWLLTFNPRKYCIGCGKGQSQGRATGSQKKEKRQEQTKKRKRKLSTGEGDCQSDLIKLKGAICSSWRRNSRFHQI